MRVLIGILLPIMVILSQSSISADFKYKIEVCETLLKSLFHHADFAQLQNSKHYWINFSHNLPLSYEPDDVEQTGVADVLAGKAKPYLNEFFTSYPNGECKTVFRENNKEKYDIHYETIKNYFSFAVKNFKYGMGKVDSREGGQVIQQAIIHLGINFPFDNSPHPNAFKLTPQATSAISPAVKAINPTPQVTPKAPVVKFEAPIRRYIEVCTIPLSVSQNTPGLENFFHIFVRSVRGNQVTAINFEAKDKNPDQKTLASIIAGEDVPSGVSNENYLNPEVRCAIILEAANDQQLDEKWSAIVEEYNYSANENYNLFANNCGMVAKRAVTKAGLGFPFENINAQNSTAALSRHVDEMLENPNPQNILGTAFNIFSAISALTGDSELSNIFDEIGKLFE